MFPRNLSLRAELIARRYHEDSTTIGLSESLTSIAFQRLFQAPLVFWNSLFNSVVKDYFELAQGCFMRMCPELEKKFPDFHGTQLELMMYLCLVAYNSEIYRGLCDDAWLRATITLKGDRVAFLQRAHVSSNSDSPEISLMARLLGNTPMCQSSWEKLESIYQSTLASRIEIRWNILSRTDYWERLQEVQRQSNSTAGVQSSLLWRIPCCSSRRGFIPITVIDHARQTDGSSLKEKVDEWRRNGGRCDLAAQLQSSVVRPTALMASPRPIEAKDVVSMDHPILGKGVAATVYKVSWRNGTYAMKSFKRPVLGMPFTERDIAASVLHPHIVHGIGYFEEDGKCRLLMEMLDKTLTRHAHEKCNMGKPPFSPEDTLDVLLQIASAVEHLHLNGVVHGDLKPDNIVLDSFEIQGNDRHFLAKVTDFGCAQFIVPGQLFKPAGGGTPKFAAPELLEFLMNNEKDQFDYPKEIDVYSFGGVAYEVLTGYQVYFKRECTLAFVTEVTAGRLKPSGSEVWRNSGLEKRFPVELIELVEKCWELHPKDRPSFSRICEVLERCKPVLQTLEDRAAEEKETAKKRAAERLKFFAMVSLFAFIWISSLTTEKSAVDPFKFIALTLFIFIVMSYLCRVIRCVVCKLHTCKLRTWFIRRYQVRRDVDFAVKVKDV